MMIRTKMGAFKGISWSVLCGVICGVVSGRRCMCCVAVGTVGTVIHNDNGSGSGRRIETLAVVVAAGNTPGEQFELLD